MAGTGKENLIKPPETSATPEVAKTPAPTSPILAQLVQQHGADPKAIATAMREKKVPLESVLEALHKMFGNSVTQQIVTELQKPEVPLTPEPKPQLPATVETGGAEPKASPAITSAKVQVEPAIALQVAQTTGIAPPKPGKPPLCPAPAVVYDEVKATLAALGFPADGKKLPIKVHHEPEMTDTGFAFKSTSVAADGAETARAPVNTNYAEGMGKKHATGALAGNDDVTLNPAGDFTTLIHETVHLFQKGEIGRFLVEPMTEVIAAMAFTRLAGKGVVTGSYAYAAEYLPWVTFVTEVLAPKIGWPKLFGYYVGQGMKTFGNLCNDLGFWENSPPMKTLKASLSNGDATKAEAIRETIKAGPVTATKAKAYEAKSEKLDSDDHDMSSFESWLPTYGKVIEKEQKSGETNAQTAQRLASENKRTVIQGAINEAKEHQKTAAAPLLGEIVEFIKAYEHALTEIPV